MNTASSTNKKHGRCWQTLEVHVTQAHIDQGIHKNPYKCPVALALKDMGFHRVRVDPDQAQWKTKNSDHMPWKVALISKEGTWYIRAIDRLDPVEPRTVTMCLSVPQNPNDTASAHTQGANP